MKFRASLMLIQCLLHKHHKKAPEHQINMHTGPSGSVFKGYTLIFLTPLMTGESGSAVLTKTSMKLEILLIAREKIITTIMNKKSH